MTAVIEDTRPVTVTAPPARATLRQRGAHPSVVLALIAAGAVATVLLWWHDTPYVHGWGDWLTNAGRVTGLLAGYGVVVLVALMARLPPLENGVGADRLARWHSMGGRYTVSLVAAHATLITWGYAVTAHTNVVSQTKALLLSYPDVLMATVAGFLLLGVGVVSMRAARRKMRYETWYYLHFYTYLAVALAFSHQFADGAEFMTHPDARIAWAAMYIAVGAAILWYRFITPALMVVDHQLRVESVLREAPDTVSIVITGQNLEHLGAQSGQFFRWRFLARGHWWVSSPYSLSAAPSAHQLRITVKALGDHSSALMSLKPGTRVIAEGPYGAMTPARRTKRKVLLVAGGVGVTPVRALLESLPVAPGDLTMVYRARNEADVLFRDELTEMARRRGAALFIVTGRRTELGRDPLSARVLKANVPDLAHHDVYVCGPPSMTAAVTASLRTAKVPRRRVHLEKLDLSST